MIGLIGLFAVYTSSELALLLYAGCVFLTLIVDVVRMMIVSMTVKPENMVRSVTTLHVATHKRIQLGSFLITWVVPEGLFQRRKIPQFCPDRGHCACFLRQA